MEDERAGEADANDDDDDDEDVVMVGFKLVVFAAVGGCGPATAAALASLFSPLSALQLMP